MHASSTESRLSRADPASSHDRDILDADNVRKHDWITLLRVKDDVLEKKSQTFVERKESSSHEY